MLTQAGRDYIATNLGINNCWVSSGLTWEAHSQQGEIAHMSGGTVFIMSNITSPETNHITLKTPRTGEFTLAMIVSNNGGNAITDADIAEIRENDGNPAGEAQYCAGGTTPTPTPTPEVPTGSSTIICSSIENSDLYLEAGGNKQKMHEFRRTDPNVPMDPGNSDNWFDLRVPVPGTYTVSAEAPGCIGYSESYKFHSSEVNREMKFQATSELMGCSASYPAYYEVKAYADDTGALLPAVARVGTTTNFCVCPSAEGEPGCQLIVDAGSEGAEVTKTIAVRCTGYQAYGPTNKGVKHTTREGTVEQVVATLIKAKPRYVVITEGTSFISDYGMSSIEQWTVGTIFRPHQSYSKTWMEVECLKVATFVIHITFTDLDGNTPANTPNDIWTEAKAIWAGDSGAAAKLEWPYFVTFNANGDVLAQEPGSWLVERKYIGTWLMWAQLGETAFVTG